MKGMVFSFILYVCMGLFQHSALAQNVGIVMPDHSEHFPLGFYEHPEDIDELKRMAQHGVNLVHCHNNDDLDEAAEAGMMGVFPLPLQNGLTDSLKNIVLEVMDHPALAVWEGPDEIIWNLTAYSGLYRESKVHTEPDEWWKQTENAVNYSKMKANEVIPKMREAVEWIQSVDSKGHPFWMNEALRSDMIYSRQYAEFMDIVGCDFYPVKKNDRRLHVMGLATNRWKQIGNGKPVWMVMQGFAWNELGGRYSDRELSYPTFDESRFMAYDVILHGAKGIIYWGSRYTQSESFRQSLYALTSELSQLHPFLVSGKAERASTNVILNPVEEDREHGIRVMVRQYHDEWLIVLINEDDHEQMAVVVRDLETLNDKTIHLLYGNETNVIRYGEFSTRMQPYGVQVWCTSRHWETEKLDGRDFK